MLVRTQQQLVHSPLRRLSVRLTPSAPAADARVASAAAGAAMALRLVEGLVGTLNTSFLRFFLAPPPSASSDSSSLWLWLWL